MPVPEMKQPSPLMVGASELLASATVSNPVATRLNEGSGTEVAWFSKTKLGFVRSMVMVSEAKPWLGPQLPLESEIEFAPSCSESVPSVQLDTATTCNDDDEKFESIVQPVAVPRIRKSPASTFETVTLVIR